MALAFFRILAVSPLLCSAFPATTPRLGVSIPLSKRASQLSVIEVVDRDFLNAQVNKVHNHNKMARGFAAYEKNTEEKCTPVAPSALLDGALEPMHCKIILNFVGTGPFKLEPLLWNSLWTLIPAAVIFPDCDSSCDMHMIYNTPSSSTAKDQNQKFNLTCGDGSAIEANVFADTFTIEGRNSRLHTWQGTHQAIGAAAIYSSQFLGTAFKELSIFGDDPMFQTLVNQDVVTTPEFACDLSASGGGELFLGGVNTDKFTGSFTTSQGFWQISMDSANVNGKAVVGNLSVIIDTGTRLIVGDAKSVSEFMNQSVVLKMLRRSLHRIPNIRLTSRWKGIRLVRILSMEVKLSKDHLIALAALPVKISQTRMDRGGCLPPERIRCYRLYGEIFFVMLFKAIIRFGNDTLYYLFDFDADPLIKFTERYATLQAFMERATLWIGGDQQIFSVTPFAEAEIMGGPVPVSKLELDWDIEEEALTFGCT
ncbi:acid protease [Guyanagaster necrorhizus]|uniref:Acid protease n=1 Tax=Guyanagaster necrorhizus TaxID=856835 RepID=A0A9P7VRH9_9AGAR|nr:acid protease [Guyanagaster necrorhizus MCA 3950]KAG7445502.1 acid protease [Guyanagaster necrorhizus MCA 3950]